MATETQTRGVALVTGASAGLGAAFAQRLAIDGYDLILVARRLDRLAQLKHDLAGTGRAVEVLESDLSRPEGIALVAQRIASQANLELLVNNAGFAGYTPFVEMRPERTEQQVNLQVLAVVLLTRAALPGMLARGRGAVINVSSRLAFSAALGPARMPNRSVYASTKAFVNAFSRLLYDELKGTGVKVQALCPGMIRTEFHAAEGMDTSRVPANIISEPEDVVEASLTSLGLDEPICVPNMEDSSLLHSIEADQKRFFENSTGNRNASRYRR